MEESEARTNLLKYGSHVKRPLSDGVDLLTHFSLPGLGGGGKDDAEQGVKGSLEAITDRGEKFVEEGVEGGGSNVLVGGGVCGCTEIVVLLSSEKVFSDGS